MKYLFIFVSLLFFTTSYSQSSLDCNCDINITSNQSLPNNIANKTVCISGNFTYTHNVDLKNKTELCIGEDVTFTGNITGNWNQEKTLRNYGVFSPSNANVNNLANVVLTNYGTVNANFNFNQGDAKVFHNYATLNTSTNTFRSGSILNYEGGEINISGSAVFGSSIIFLNEGNINTNQNLEFEADLTLGGNYVVGGNTTFNSSNLYLENANFAISGNVNIWSNVHLQTNANNQCSEIYFSTINQWHGLISANHGNLSMTSFPNTQNVSGSVIQSHAVLFLSLVSQLPLG